MMYIQNQVESAHLLTPAEEQDHLKICKSQLVLRSQIFWGGKFVAGGGEREREREREREKGASCAQIGIVCKCIVVLVVLKASGLECIYAFCFELVPTPEEKPKAAGLGWERTQRRREEGRQKSWKLPPSQEHTHFSFPPYVMQKTVGKVFTHHEGKGHN